MNDAHPEVAMKLGGLCKIFKRSAFILGKCLAFGHHLIFFCPEKKYKSWVIYRTAEFRGNAKSVFMVSLGGSSPKDSGLLPRTDVITTTECRNV